MAHTVLVRHNGEVHPILVKKGMTADDFNRSCSIAFANLAEGARVTGLRDDISQYTLELLFQYPSEFEANEYHLVVQGGGGGGGGGSSASSAASAAAAGSENILYFESCDLGLTPADCTDVKALTQLSGLGDAAFEDVHDTFARAASAGPDGVPVLTKDAFDACLNQLLPTSVSAEARARMYAMLVKAFYLSDRTEAQCVNFAEFVAGFALFCRGRKSDKLALAFRVFDSNEDGLLSRREIWRFLRSFLTVLFSLSESAGRERTEDLYIKIDDATVAAAQMVFAEAEAEGQVQDGGVSFDVFGTWYNKGGYILLPWIELLDLAKWPETGDADAADAAPSRSAGESKGAEAGAADDDSTASEAALEFPLSDDGIVLQIGRDDVIAYQLLLNASGLNEVAPGTMVTELLSEVRDSGLSQAGFERAVERLTGSAPSAPVRAALLRLFAAFDYTGVGSVDAASFVSGFLMLAGGSKSDKLALAFRLFDEDADGFLSRRELWKYLRSFLSVLVALSDRYENMPDAARNDFVDSGAVEATATVFLQASREHDDKVSFTEFGLWYNNGGFMLTPWVELLDHNKWPDVEEGGSAEGGSAESGSADGGSGTVFVFPLDDSGETVLEITEADVNELMRLVEISRINEIHADELVDAFAEEAPSGSLSKSGFDRAIRKLVPGASLDARSKEYLSFALSNLFYAFDRDGNDAVDFDEFVAGFSLLANGSKSDKLALAFRMFDEDGDGYISRREMWRYMRAYLTMLASLNEGTRALTYADVSAIVDGAAVDLTRRVFSDADLNKDNFISYEEFGQWYNEGGFQVIPWLELLDLRKWRAAIDAPAAPAARAAPAAPAASDEGDVVFEFSLGGDDGDVFVITGADVKHLRRVIAASHLAEKELPALHAEFKREAEDGVLDKPAFDRAIRRLIPGSSLSPEDKQFLSFALSNIFFAFDRDGNNVVDFDEFLSGFSLLVQGSKSDKLALAFRMFDEDGDGYISRLEMWKYLRAFLTMLMSVNTLSQRLPVTEVQTLVDKAAVELTKAVFSSADLDDDGRISYEEFGQWYNAGGFDIIPWLELLDLRKWPELSDEDDYEGSADEGAEPVFEFQLSAEGGDALQITASDVANLQRLNDKARLQRMSPEQLYRAFASEAKDGVLDKSGFDRVVRQLVPGESLTKEDKGYLSFALSNVFYAFDRDQNGVVDFNEFASGFSILAGGSKSDKLSLAFHLFDLDSDGYISRRELWEYLRAFLTVLVALNGGMQDVDPKELVVLIDRNALELTGTVFEQADTDEDDRISYEEFGQWYNEGGFQVIPWLELLDLRKWPTTAAEDGAAAGGDGEEEDEEEEGEDEEEEDDDAEDDEGANGAGEDDDVVFQFVLGDDGNTLLISARDVATLRRVVGTSGLGEVDLDTLHRAFSKAATDGVLNKSAFDRVVRDLIPGETLTKEDKAFLSFALSNIFFAFDRDGNNLVDFDEFAAGFSLLSSGSKSDKLSLAFRLFDEDGDGFISRREMWKYLRAFLTVLVSLKELSGVASVTELQTLIDKAAMDLTGTIMTEADLNKDGRISYEEFGQWYNSGGFEMIPWLELLDLGKWPMSEGGAADDDDEDESSSAGGEGSAADGDDGGDAADGGDGDEDVDGEPDDESDSGGESLAPVFEFQLTDAGDMLEITEADCDNIAAVNAKAGLIGKTPDELVTSFQREVTSAGQLTKEAFDGVVRSLVPGERLSAKDKSFLSFALSNIFYSFDRDGSNAVDFDEFAAGFTILAGGSKSDKLSLAFRLFDADNDGFATRREMWQFLRAFLTVLMAINMLSTAVDDTTVLTVVDNSCGELISKLWEGSASERANRDKISYEEFGVWYNKGGFAVLPWLELLDLRKWATPAQ